MSHSLAANYLHIVFSTKYRQPLITPDIEDELYAYLGGICKNQDCKPIQIGGYMDHVHILCLLSKKLMLYKLVEHLKSHSSKWIKQKGDQFKNFYWQRGYGAFSVDPRKLDVVARYIANQHQHHKNMRYLDEYPKMLNKFKIPFDERYIWD